MFRLIFIILAGLLYACGAQGSSEGSTKQLTEADTGRSLELSVGDQLEITLPANPTTGFQWEVDVVDITLLRQIGEPEFEAAGNAVGSGGQVTLRFEAVGTGQTELKLIHHRVFEEDVLPLQIFELSITVR